MEEQFDVVTPEGQPTGQSVSRSRAHREGLWHRSSHLWLLNSARTQILLQRRHPGKQTDPGRWDIAVAGHVSAGQTPLEALVREAFEELGLVIAPQALTFLAATPKQYLDLDYKDREWQHVFAGVWDGDPANLVLQPEEVVGARWMDLAEYRHMLEARDDGYVGRADDLGLVADWINHPI